MGLQSLWNKQEYKFLILIIFCSKLIITLKKKKKKPWKVFLSSVTNDFATIIKKQGLLLVILLNQCSVLIPGTFVLFVV